MTLSCAEGNVGYIYDGTLEFEAREVNVEDLPEAQTAMMVNLASPAAALLFWRQPAKGVGLARMEFIINN